MKEKRTLNKDKFTRLIEMTLILIITMVVILGMNIKANSNNEEEIYKEEQLIEKNTNTDEKTEVKVTPENITEEKIVEILEEQLSDSIFSKTAETDVNDRKDGRDGIDGIDGKNGKNGRDGKNGLDGRDGKDGKDGIDGKNGRDGINGKNGKNGKDGVDGYTPIKGVDYFTNSDVEELAEKASELVYQEHMQRIIEGVTLNLMEDGNITLSTYERDVIETIVSRLMEETASEEYIKDQVIDIVQNMISTSLSEPYSSNVVYQKGNVVTYHGVLYLSNVDNNQDEPGTTNSWLPTTLTKLINRFNTDVASKLDEVNYRYIPDGDGTGRVVVTIVDGGQE